MSYDVTIADKSTGAVLTAPCKHGIAGGTYSIGGTDEAWLNVTYNYGAAFAKAFGESGIRALEGKSSKESINMILEAAARLSDDKTGDYWEPTEGNAKYALLDLAKLALLFPDGIWRIG